MRRILSILAFFIIVFRVPDADAQSVKSSYATTSLLANGLWYKIGITSDGIYRIDYSKLKQLGFSNLSNPRIYGNNFGQLSYYNDDPKPDDLKEIPIQLVKGSDGIFNEGDYLLFFGLGTNRWKYSALTDEYKFVRHNYSDTAFYFITTTPVPGKLIINEQSISYPASYSSTSYDALYMHEVESENLIKSGREWYQPISGINGLSINPGFSEIITSEKMDFKIRVLGRASVSTSFRFYDGTNMLNEIPVQGVYLLSTTGTFAETEELTGTAFPSSSSPVYEVRFNNNGETGAKGWVDYVRFRARANTGFSGKTLVFSDSRSVQPGRVTEFSVKTTLQAVNIWDVTDPDSTKNINYTKTGDNLIFKSRTDSLRTFIAFTNDKAVAPAIIARPVSNQNLHGSEAADMVIVTPDIFRSYAAKLAAIHQNNSGLISVIVSPGEIYNEYSGGVPDIAAIRNFVRMKYLYQAGSSRPLKYLLLFGDGSVENKTLPPNNPNFIPTYQSQNSTTIVSSFTSDDFYGLLDTGEGEASGTEDIGIGRFPVSDTSQAGVMVTKVANYISAGGTGDWRNVICISADDEDGNAHLMDAEGLSSLLENDWPSFNVDKIYLDAFRQITSVNGQSYPDVTKAINDRISSGCLIFNYLGHGNEIGLAHERVVKTENINSWKNSSKLPLFITATCEFSRFDDVELNIITREFTGKNSAGEMVLLNPVGGGIALMTTTRVVYSAPNYVLNRNIYNYAFTRDKDGNALGLGDIIRLAKNNSGNGPNKRNFLLLGDPALTLSYPWHGKVVTDSINNTPVTQPIDSLKALSLITISGHIENNTGNILNDFNGVVFPVVFDKSSKIKTLANDGGSIMEFNLLNNILFSGKTKATDGKFTFRFIVPKDIDYAFGKGKISYYASEGTSDMAGKFTDFIAGGFSNSGVIDTTGPLIKIYLNDTLFRNGGISDNNPSLLAILEDKGGINTTGSGIGHDITAYLDNEKNKSFILNSFFENDFDNYKRGRIVYQLNDLIEGSHSMHLKAWDNFNNSSESLVTFIVKSDKGFILNNLINYPNPFTDQTNITAEHNRPDENLDVKIYIYSQEGKIIKMIRTNLIATGYKLPPIFWDGYTDNGGRAIRGIYPYSVTVTTEKGETARVSGRMIIL